ncbi:transposase [Pseudobdellovibrio sp. HCB154]|uniref:transposase n=1 Tax=Pseudobdellovibrio sp. HCB154 TaxID=3386277 RepID=UPI0039173DC1
MPRKKLIYTLEFPYHITNRSNNQEFFYIKSEDLWPIFIACLEQLKVQFQCEIHAFVLMSNHYHLLISTPNGNIGEAMKYLHREVARKANKESKRINHFFGGRYKWTVVASENYYWNAMKYIFRNPVRAGMCASVTNYKFSSLNSPIQKDFWKLTDHFNNREVPVQLDLEWLDENYEKEAEENIRLALRRREFKPPRSGSGRGNLLDVPRIKKGTVTPGLPNFGC